MKTVAVGDLANEIMKGLEEYSDLATEDVKKAVRKSANTVRKEIKENAPKDTGVYQKSWSVKTDKETSSSLSLIVHSKNRYQLAHLLEKGHVTRNGTSRVSGKPHIAPAEENGVRLLEEEIKRTVKG